MSAWSSSVYAEETTERAVTLKKGQKAPFDGILLTNTDLALLEKEMQALEEMNASLQKDLEDLRTFYSDSLDTAYDTFISGSDAIMKQIGELDTTPVVINETEWWEPLAWVATGALIVGAVWVVDSGF